MLAARIEDLVAVGEGRGWDGGANGEGIADALAARGWRGRYLNIII